MENDIKHCLNYYNVIGNTYTYKNGISMFLVAYIFIVLKLIAIV